MAGIVFLVIFFGIVGFLIILAVYGSRKDKAVRQRDVIKRKKEDTISSAKHKELYLKLYFLVSNLEEKIEHFDPLGGFYSIGDINKNFSKAILDIKNSNDLQDVFLFEERKSEFKPVIDELVNTKPSKWNLESNFALSLIKSKSEFLKDDPSNEELVKLAKKWVERETNFNYGKEESK